MATTIHEEDGSLEAVGQTIGALGLIAMRRRQQKKEEEEKMRFQELTKALGSAPDRESALALSIDPRYSDMFEDVDDHVNFGKMARSMRPDLFEEHTETTVQVTGYAEDGTERPFYIDKKKLQSADDPLAGTGYTLKKPTKKPGKTNLYNDRGELVRQVLEGEETLPDNDPLLTEKEMQFRGDLESRRLAREKEARLKRDAESGAAGGKDAEWTAAAKGDLQAAGIDEPSQQQINIATTYARYGSNHDRDVRNSFNISDTAPLDKLDGTASGEKYRRAQTVFSEIKNAVLQGQTRITPEQASTIAIRAAKARYGASGKDAKPVTSYPEITDPADLDKYKPGAIIRVKGQAELFVVVDGDNLVEID